MRSRYSRYIALQMVIMIFVFAMLIFTIFNHQRTENDYDVAKLGQTVSYSVQQNLVSMKSVFTSLSYNYEIDNEMSEEKFEMLAEKYMKEYPQILYIQHKDKDTATDLVYPDDFNYTLRAKLTGRPEVEEAVQKAIKDRAATANDPFILKGTENLLGLVLRTPVYRDDEFEGFFVVVYDLDNYLEKTIEDILPESGLVRLYDKKNELIWSNYSGKDEYTYESDIPVLDNHWTIRISDKSSSLEKSSLLLFYITILVFGLMMSLLYLQMRIYRKDRNIERLSKLNNEIEKLRQSYTLALDSANDALWEYNAVTGDIITSDKWLIITGNMLDGKGVSTLFQRNAIHEDDYEDVTSLFDDCLNGKNDEFQIQYRIKNRHDEYTWVQNKGKVYLDKKGNPVRLAGAVSDIEEQKKKEADIEYLAYFDSLTGMPNKISFMMTLEELIEKADNEKSSYYVLMIDLDNFKTHNDLLGLEFCDLLLIEASKRLLKLIGENNLAARFGGDEFLILIREKSTVEEAESLCSKMLRDFNEPFVISDNSVYISVSIGIVYGMDLYSNPYDVMRNVDIALNRAKYNGKNAYSVYDSRMHEEILRRSKIEDCLREKLMDDVFEINYQLQQDLRSNEIRGMEALARLYCTELGSISPFEFIHVAEYTGLIVPLGKLILRNACIQGKKWIDSGFDIGKLSVNISVNQLKNDEFYDNVCKIINETGFPYEFLELEITENVFLDHSNQNTDVLSKLRNLGISIALDDFGTGYASLNYLTLLPIDTLKIDKSFLGKSLDTLLHSEIIKTIIELAHILDLKVICEGVETEKQMNILRDMGCDHIQGYYYARPETAGKVEIFLRKRN
ncbi:EAL domain-containing protein [Proteocatella sphenisci]|uniref:EAL domain-containing protein n=1 Tax=Proteocatella sphenisci TaxID=181070 RepID=UPI0005609627|nr:EAL domain-containing protein [Proteocatella sphenisci]